ncbi:type II toxin-antitoxin system PemK/MazF family toxin [Methylobacterium radiodurans]|uniref:Growth inhibitor PemK n=1 Tax=Methylobacterium radiodurans TaxID=2202828 RepID=A0A2U8VS62_9HYPH|nr:type II toxin-antitoxin system PemK/MazF family toxin [Methylobacterium radiodurans]AWN36291.1 growth inhibitor PemK [Methylobacterium radiodurans]
MARRARRGDLITVSAPGAYRKPRPAVVVQSDWLSDTDSVLVCLLTSTLRKAPIYRLTMPADADTGSRTVSQVMVDKAAALPRAKCGPVLGRLAGTELLALNHMLSLMLGLAD